MKKSMGRLDKFKDWLSAESGNLDEVLDWWVFPSPKKPRILIPTSQLHWDAGLHFIHSSKKRLAVKLLLKIYRLIRRKPDLSFPVSLPKQLTENLSEEPSHFAGYVSTSSRFSKYTLSVLNSDGEVLAYAKLVEGKDAPSAIASEAKNLELLQDRFPAEAFYPTILFSDVGFSLQTPAPPAGNGSLARKAGNISAKIFGSKCHKVTWNDCENRKILLGSVTVLESFKKPELAEILIQMDELLVERSGDTLFRQGFNHGDFVSWNLINSGNGFVFDWEWSGDLIEFYDLFQFLWFQHFGSQDEGDLDFLLSLWGSEIGQDLLTGYFSKETDRERPFLIHAAIYCATSYAFHCEHCTANDDDPTAYEFLHSLRKTFFKIMEKSEGFSVITEALEKKT